MSKKKKELLRTPTTWLLVASSAWLTGCIFANKELPPAPPPPEPPVTTPAPETTSTVQEAPPTPPASPPCVLAKLDIPKGDVCIALAEGRIHYIPLDGSGAVQGPSTGFSPSGLGNASLGLRGADLYTCTGTVTRISLVDGHSEQTDVPCASVTADKNGILVLNMMVGRLERYADHASLVAHRVADTFEAPYASRIALGSGGELLAAWHAADELLVGPLGGPTTATKLAGYDGWIMGLDRMSDGRFVIGTWFTERQLRVFDKTGKFERSIELPAGVTMVDGLVCGTGAELAASACIGADASTTPQRKPSVSIAENCGSGGYTSSNYTEATNASDATELHIVGVYEGQYGAGPTHGPCWEGDGEPPVPGLPQCPPVRPRGKMTIHVKATPRPVVLVLTSYEPVDYTITSTPDARIAKIVTQGYYEHTVTGAPAGTPITTSQGSYAYGWEPAHNTGGASFPLYVNDIRTRESSKETSFQGCYSGDRFEIPYQ